VTARVHSLTVRLLSEERNRWSSPNARSTPDPTDKRKKHRKISGGLKLNNDLRLMLDMHLLDLQMQKGDASSARGNPGETDLPLA